MVRWTFDHLIGSVEYIRSQKLGDPTYRITILDLSAETGINYNLLQRLSKGHKAMVYTSVLEILISWATHETGGVPFGIEDLIVITPEPWNGPIEDVRAYSTENGPEVVERPEGSGTRSSNWVEERKAAAERRYQLGTYLK